MLFVVLSLQFCAAQDTIFLPTPDTTGGMPLMEALANRKSGRDYADKKLDKKTLSNLLWAAFGINRPESGKRTAPSAVNWQEIDMYVALPDAIYLYSATLHGLIKIKDGDYREGFGKQRFVKDASIMIGFVSDYSKISPIGEKKKQTYSYVDTGFISQNIYLFCASEGLSTVVLGMINRDKISEILELNNNQHVIFTQCVGYPAVEQTFPSIEE